MPRRKHRSKGRRSTEKDGRELLKVDPEFQKNPILRPVLHKHPALTRTLKNLKKSGVVNRLVNRVLFGEEEEKEEQEEEKEEEEQQGTSNFVDIRNMTFDDFLDAPVGDKTFEHWKEHMPSPRSKSTPKRKHSGIISPRSMRSFIKKGYDSSLETPTLKKYIAKNTSDMADLLDVTDEDVLTNKAIIENIKENERQKLERKSEVVLTARDYGDQIREEYNNTERGSYSEQVDQRHDFFEKWKKLFPLNDIMSEIYKKP